MMTRIALSKDTVSCYREHFLLRTHSDDQDSAVKGHHVKLQKVFSYYRMCSQQNVFSYYRMCSLTIECVHNRTCSLWKVFSIALSKDTMSCYREHFLQRTHSTENTFYREHDCNDDEDSAVKGHHVMLQKVFSYYRMCSQQNVFSYYRMCSLTIECVLLLQNVFSIERVLYGKCSLQRCQGTPCHAIENTFCREHILQRTHSTENVFAVKGNHIMLQRTHSTENRFY